MQNSREKGIFMGRTAAIICEFNPLHTGHVRLMRKAREKGAERIVCIMSGNFVQRGEAAITDKFTRAKAALLCGADLVLELPMPFSAGSAEYFARAGVSIADRLGCVDELIFGSELGDVEKLTEIAENQLSEGFSALLADTYSAGEGYASALQKTYESLFGDCDSLKNPNNILAIEYIKALRRINSKIVPSTVAREDNFSSEVISGEYPSATALRKLIYDGNREELMRYMPIEAYSAYTEAEKDGFFPVSTDKYGLCLLSTLRLSSPESLSECEGMSGGLENRIIQAALDSVSYEDMLKRLATKKYTDARLRRTLLFAVLGVKHSDMFREIPYVSLLAANREGRVLLSEIRKTSDIEITTKISDVKAFISALEGEKKASAERLYEVSGRADALYSLCFEKAGAAGTFGKMSPFVTK